MGIRHTFSLPVLDILSEFILLGKAEKNEILEHQAKLLALYWGQQAKPDFAQKDLCKVPRFGKANKLLMETEMTRLDVTSADVKKARTFVISRMGMPAGVPLIGKIATDLGYIENDFLEAIVKGQTGQAILKVSAQMAKMELGAGKPGRLITDLHEESQIARNYIGKYDDDSASVVTGQACLHLADIFAGLFNEESAAKTGCWGEICNIFETIGYLCLKASAEHLAALGHLSDARDINQELPEHVDVELHNDTLDIVRNSLRAHFETLKASGVFDRNMYDHAQSLLKKRFEQIDLSTLMNIESQHEDLDLKERLRLRLSSMTE